MRLPLVPGSWELAATSNSGSNERAGSEVAPTSGSTMSTCSLPRSTRPHFNLLRPRRVSRAEAPGRPFCRVAHDDTCGSGACPGLHQRWRSLRTRVRVHAPQALENAMPAPLSRKTTGWYSGWMSFFIPCLLGFLVLAGLRYGQRSSRNSTCRRTPGSYLRSTMRSGSLRRFFRVTYV